MIWPNLHDATDWTSGQNLDQNPTQQISCILTHGDVIKWKHFPRYWPFVRGIHQSPVNSPNKWPVTRSCDVSFDLRLNKRLNKQSWGWWFETLSCPLWRHCNVSLLCKIVCRHGTYNMFVRYFMCLRLNLFFRFSWCILWKCFYFYHTTIIKSEICIIRHCLALRKEDMVCAVCLTMLLYWYPWRIDYN